MFINQALFRIRSLSIELMVSNRGDYRSFFYHSNSNSTLNSAMYLKFSYRLNSKGKTKALKEGRLDSDITEKFIMSAFDLYQFKKALRDLGEYLEQDYYRLEERIDEGAVPVFNDGFEDFLVKFQNSTEKEIIAFRPCFLYKRADDFYSPAVQVMINRDDVAVNIPVPHFMSIIEYFKTFDLHNASMALISSYTADINSKNYRSSKSDAAKTFKNQGVTEGE